MKNITLNELIALITESTETSYYSLLGEAPTPPEPALEDNGPELQDGSGGDMLGSPPASGGGGDIPGGDTGMPPSTGGGDPSSDPMAAGGDDAASMEMGGGGGDMGGMQGLSGNFGGGGGGGGMDTGEGGEDPAAEGAAEEPDPSTYNPFKDAETLEDRLQVVLDTATKIAEETQDPQKVLRHVKGLIQNGFSNPQMASKAISDLFQTENPVLQQVSRRLALFTFGI